MSNELLSTTHSSSTPTDGSPYPPPVVGTSTNKPHPQRHTQLQPSGHSLPATPFCGPSMRPQTPHTHNSSSTSAVLIAPPFSSQGAGGGGVGGAGAGGHLWSSSSPSHTPLAAAAGRGALMSGGRGGGGGGRGPSGGGGGGAAVYSERVSGQHPFHTPNGLHYTKSPSTSASHHTTTHTPHHGVNITIPANWNFATTPTAGATFAAEDFYYPSVSETASATTTTNNNTMLTAASKMAGGNNFNHNNNNTNNNNINYNYQTSNNTTTNRGGRESPHYFYPNNNSNNTHVDSRLTPPPPPHSRNDSDSVQMLFKLSSPHHHQGGEVLAPPRPSNGGDTSSVAMRIAPDPPQPDHGAHYNGVENNENHTSPNAYKTEVAQQQQQHSIGGGEKEGLTHQRHQNRSIGISSNMAGPAAKKFAKHSSSSASATIPATQGGVLRPMWAKGIEWEAVKK